METYDGRLTEFLDRFMESHADVSAAVLEDFEADFKKSLTHCKLVFGENMFIDTSKERRRQSMVYFDLLMQTLGEVSETTLGAKKEKILKAFERLCKSDDFQRSLSGGLANRASILRRQTLWSRRLKRALA